MCNQINEFGEVIRQKNYINNNENKDFFIKIQKIIKSRDTAQEFLKKYEDENILNEDKKVVKFLIKLFNAIQKFDEIYKKFGLEKLGENYNNEIFEGKLIDEISTFEKVDKPEQYSWFNRFMYYIEEIKKIKKGEKDEEKAKKIRQKLLKDLQSKN